jgi:hypothetical protein
MILWAWRRHRESPRFGERFYTSLAFGNVNAAEPMLPSWVLPFFAATASSDVEFLNYLIAIYPLLILFGAGRRKGWTVQTRSVATPGMFPVAYPKRGRGIVKAIIGNKCRHVSVSDARRC